MHSRILTDGTVEGAEVVAVCELSEANLAKAKETFDDKVNLFNNADAFFASGDMDAVLITTPHYFHPELAIRAFENGLHVLCEKPAGVFTKNVRQMNAAAEASGKVFSLMFQFRTNPLYIKMKQLIDDGDLGAMKRNSYLITKWYRSQFYYNAGGWRGTWAGEGGGVLMNQCPHQLDLWQWVCGMPKRVRAFCSFGKYHDIEVEDDVTAYVEYENGSTGLFVASTGEFPGTDRLEVSGDMGKILAEEDELTFWKNAISERKFNATNDEKMFGKPENTKLALTPEGDWPKHAGIWQNFIDVIQNGGELISPGIEGVNSLEAANAMLLSTWTDDWVDLPIDEDLFYEQLQKRITDSK